MTVAFEVRSGNQTIAVTWHGDDLQKAVHEERANALFAGAQVVLRAARPLTPRRSGRLRKSGYAKAAGGKSTYRGGRGRRKPPRLKRGTALAAFAQFYAGFQERGTRRHRAQPFMGPALQRKRTAAARAVANEMAKEVGL